MVINCRVSESTNPRGLREPTPNILYIHSHDTGRYVQPYGYQVPTPNIQMLADQGAFFRQAFCAAPTCSGSRASLLTGQYCHNNGMFGLAHRGWSLNDYGQHLIHPLRTAGYRSVLIGEQHISEDPGVIGYDEVIEVDSNHAAEIAPIANSTLRRGRASRSSCRSASSRPIASSRCRRSVRDTLYSLPPPNLPDTVETREDMAAFKASARSLDQGIGSVLNELHRLGIDENTLIVCTTDHGLAFPRAKATLFDRGTGVMLLMRGPGGFTGGKVFDSMVSHLDIYPTLCELAGVEPPDFLQGTSLLPLVRGEVGSIHDEIFTEMTFHAAYEPQRAIRTERWKYIRRFHDYEHPVLANCDDSATKDLLVEAAGASRSFREEQLYDLLLDPNENRDLSADSEYAQTRKRLAARLREWMEDDRRPAAATARSSRRPARWRQPPGPDLAEPRFPTSARARPSGSRRPGRSDDEPTRSYLVCATPRSGQHPRLQGAPRDRRRRPPRGVLRGAPQHRPAAAAEQYFAGVDDPSIFDELGEPAEGQRRRLPPGAGPPTTATSSGRWRPGRRRTASSARS